MCYKTFCLKFQRHQFCSLELSQERKFPGEKIIAKQDTSEK